MSERSSIAMRSEGQLLMAASCSGQAAASAAARGTIDGCFNALLRFEGPEKAYEFATALADRVAGGLKGETLWPPVKPEAPKAEEAK